MGIGCIALLSSIFTLNFPGVLFFAAARLKQGADNTPLRCYQHRRRRWNHWRRCPPHRESTPKRTCTPASGPAPSRRACTTRTARPHAPLAPRLFSGASRGTGPTLTATATVSAVRTDATRPEVMPVTLIFPLVNSRAGRWRQWGCFGLLFHPIVRGYRTGAMGWRIDTSLCPA